MTTYKTYLTWMTAIWMVLSSLDYALVILDLSANVKLPYGVTKTEVLVSVGVGHIISDVATWCGLAVVGLIVCAMVNSLKTQKQ